MNDSTFVLLCAIFLFGLACGGLLIALVVEENPRIYWATVTKDDGLYCYDQRLERFNPCDEVDPTTEGVAQSNCSRYMSVVDCEVRRAVPSNH